MTNIAYSSFAVLGILLQVCLVGLMVHEHQIRRYPLVGCYAVCQLIMAVVEWVLSSNHETKRLFETVYWADEVILDLLLFLLVILLTFKTLEGQPRQQSAGRVLGFLAVVAIALPSVLVSFTTKTHWFNGTSQILNFGAALMNLVLWTALIGTHQRDSQLLTISAGLGVGVTGAAISYGLRQWISKSEMWIPNMFLILAHIALLMLWCWAFRPKPNKSQGMPVTRQPESMSV